MLKAGSTRARLYNFGFRDRHDGGRLARRARREDSVALGACGLYRNERTYKMVTALENCGLYGTLEAADYNDPHVRVVIVRSVSDAVMLGGRAGIKRSG